MSCSIFIISLSLSLLVLLGGLFLLAYSKKEGLGKITKIASYVAILFGSAVFVCGLLCATMCNSCKGSKCEKGSMECRKEMRGHCSESKCEKGMSDMSHCDKSEMGSCSEEKGECSKSKCEKGMEAEHCKKDGKDCCKEAIEACNKKEGEAK